MFQLGLSRHEEEPLLSLAPSRPAAPQVRLIRWVAVVSLLALGFLAWPAGEVGWNSSGARTRAAPLNLEEKSRARILHLAYKPMGKCLDLQGSQHDPDLLHAVLRNCDFTRILSSQMWIVDPDQGMVRNVLHSNKCLATNQFRELAYFGAETCQPFGRGHLWGITEHGQLVTLKRKVAGLPSAYCAVPAPGHFQEDEPFLVLQACLGSKSPTHQNQWAPVGTEFGSNVLAEQRKRPKEAIEAEQQRREATEEGSGKLLTVKELVQTLGFASVQKEHFWWRLKDIFGALGPGWNRWQDVLSFRQKLAHQSDGNAVMMSSVLVNILSNMAFAGMNFIQGSNGKDLTFLDQCHLPLQLYTHQPLECDSTPSSRRADCTFQIPNYMESLKLTNLAHYVSSWKAASLFSSFKELYTAEKEPSWEDKHGQSAVLRMAAEGLETARAAGVHPADLAADVRDGFRFAFDLEGILAMLQEGFYWNTFSQMKYANNGAFGAAVVEDQADGDVLGFLMMKSQLAMHLTEKDGLLVADLADLEQYKPLPGFAPLGGKATFQWKDGKLTTVQLQYRGKTYDAVNKADPAETAKFQQSALEGWTFAEKAIIASLLAKTQLLIHVKTIHMELAPTLQAVTIDSLKGFKEHPLRQFLEPFTTRNIQAANNNLKIWFEFRGAEFGLAPLSVEEQLKLIADHMASVPLNLAELDMQRFAKVRGWDKLGFAPAWYQRAIEVQKLFDELIREFAQGAFEGDDANLVKDEGVVMWWKSLYEKMPSLRKAAEGHWLNSDKKSAGIDYDVVEAKVAAITGNETRPLPDLQPYIPPLVDHPPGYWTTKVTTTTTTTTETFTGFYRPLNTLSQNPAGVLPPGAFSPPPTPKFKNFYSSVQDLSQDQASKGDNFFDLKSWLPPSRRLQNALLGQVASGLGNMAIEMGTLQDQTAGVTQVTGGINQLASKLDTLKDAATGVTDVNVSDSMKDLMKQMHNLQDRVENAKVAQHVEKLAKEMAALQEKSKALDVTDTIRDVGKQVHAMQEAAGGTVHAVQQNLEILVNQMKELKDKAAGAVNVSGGIDQLTSEVSGLKDAAQGAGRHSAFSSELDALKDQRLGSNVTHSLEILEKELAAVQALSTSVVSSTQSLANEYDKFQAKSKVAIEVSQGIVKAAKRMNDLQALSAEALLAPDRINVLAKKLHSLEANASEADEVSKGINQLAEQIAKVEEEAADALKVADAIHKFSASIDDFQDQAHDVVDVRKAIRDFAGHVDSFKDQALSDTSQAAAGISDLDSQLGRLQETVEVGHKSSKASKGAGKEVTHAVNGLADQMGALKNQSMSAMKVVNNLEKFMGHVDDVKVSGDIVDVAGSIDQFAGHMDALKEKANSAVEVNAGVKEVDEKIKAMQGKTADALGATAGLKKLTDELDAMEAKTRTAVRVANGIKAVTSQMEVVKVKAGDTMNVSREMDELTKKLDALKVKTAASLNVSATIQTLADKVDVLKKNQSADAVDRTKQLASDIQQLKYSVEIAALNAVHSINEMASQAKALKEKVSIEDMVTGPDSITVLAMGLQTVQKTVRSGATNVTAGLDHLAETVGALQKNTSQAIDASDSLKALAQKMEKLQVKAKSFNVSGSIDKLASRLNTLQDQSAGFNVATSITGINNLAERMDQLQDQAQAVNVGKNLSKVANQLQRMSLRPPGVSTQALPSPAFQLGVPLAPAPVLPVLPALTTPVATVVTPSPAVAALTIAGMQGGSLDSDQDLEGDKPSSKWRETSMSKEELQQLLQKLPPLNVETMTRVLRTMFLWTSWIHEDVGHAWASFIYNPIHTPGFVPEDGRGIPLPALVYRVAMFRNFVALERNKLVDPIDNKMFSTTICNPVVGPYSWTSCQNEVDGVLANAFTTFQRKLRQLGQQEVFAEFAQHGLFSRVDDVESSASS